MLYYNCRMEPAKNKGGRPRKDPSQLLKLGAMRLKQSQWDKVHAAGMTQFRQLIDRWKPKPSKPE